MDVQRIALGVRYDGSAYHGWQRQEGLATVQGSLESALSFVANHTVNLTCAGRTDAGVHATAQVVHFNTEAERTDHSWIFGANSHLSRDISVQWAKAVPMEFHARFSAQARRYRYIIYNHEIRPAILQRFVGWYYKQLDVDLMQQAGNYLIGEHDFNAYRGAGCQSESSHRNMKELTVTRQGRMVIIEVCANAFLLHMVRNIAGMLVEVGTGARPPQWAKEILESGDRSQAAATFSPNGLYMVQVEYPNTYELPPSPLGPFFLPLT